MGICKIGSGVEPELRRQKQQNKQIQAEQDKAATERSELLKLLLLGPGESGKSTILKQIRILRIKAFTQDELLEFRQLIYSNLISAASALLLILSDHRLLNQSNACKDLNESVQHAVEAKRERDRPSRQFFDALRVLWSDKSIEKIKNDNRLSHSAQYFLDNLERIWIEDYIPTEQDVIRIRVATTGVVEMFFQSDGLKFKVIDVGGQKSERRKWMHQFDDVQAVLFVIAISDYDRMMEEDSNMNRITDSKELFENTINNKWFSKTPVILFLNKKDLFEEKISKVPLSVAFKEYQGAQDYCASVQFIKKEFRSVDQNTERVISIHESCATDKNQIELVIKDVLHDICEANFKQQGLV